MNTTVDIKKIPALSKNKGFDVVESDSFKKDLKKLSVETLVGLAKWYNARLDELFAAGCEDRDWDCTDDGFDYRMQGAISGGRQYFTDVLKDKVEPVEDEGAIHYPLSDVLETFNIDLYEIE